MRRSIVFRSAPVLALAATAAASLGWAAGPAVAQTAPPNDNYLSSTIVPQGSTTGMKLIRYHDTEDLTAATTQGDLFNPDQSGLPFAGGGPEPLTCGASHYGQTIWYDIHPKVPEGLQLSANGVPNVMAVYRWSLATSKIVATLGCQAAPSGVQTVNVPGELQKGDAYTVQVGALSASTGPVSGSVAFSAAFVPDHDGDGVYDALDACPTLAGILKLGGCPPVVSPSVNWDMSGQMLTEFQVGALPAASRIALRCSCGISQTKAVGTHARVVMITALLKRTVPVGATLQLWATKRPSGTGTYRFGAIGTYLRYTVHAGGLGVPVKRCLMPGSLKPQRQCPAGGRRKVSG